MLVQTADYSTETSAGPILHECDGRAAEAHHRIANSLSLLAGIVRFHARRTAAAQRGLDSAAAAALLEDVSARIVTIGELHRLLISAPDGEVDLNDHLFTLATKLAEAVASPGTIELRRAAVQPCRFASRRLAELCMFVAEAVINAIKYAHPGGAPGRLTIGCRCVDGALLVEIADDGVGFPDGFDPAVDGGVGMQTMRTLARQLKAGLAFDSSPLGLCVQLRLPPA